MNKMKKFISLLLAAVMVLSVMTVNVFADDDGSITIKGAIAGATYNAYQIFTTTVTNGKYNYKVNSDWEDFFAEGGEGEDYVSFDIVGNVIPENLTTATAAAFAKAAEKYAEEKSVSEAASATAGAGDTTIKLSPLALGYYLVTSSVSGEGSSGRLCMLDTVDSDITISDKNFLPNIEKVIVDGTDELKANDTEIGKEIDFKVTIHTDKDPKNYVLKDTLPAGMTLVPDSVKVSGLNADQYDIDETTLTIEFDENLTLEANHEIIVTYSATLNKNAVAGDAGNKNTVELSFYDKANNKDDSREDFTTTYTGKIDVFKHDSKDVALEGAKFVLKNEDGDYYKWDGEKVTWVGSKDEAVVTSDTNGKLSFNGLEAGDYILEETEAPDGYNLLNYTIKVTVSETGEITAKINETDGDAVTLNSDKAIPVENNTGAELPETGGIGTMIFRVGGAAMIIAAGALLIAKKRTNNI